MLPNSGLLFNLSTVVRLATMISQRGDVFAATLVALPLFVSAAFGEPQCELSTFQSVELKGSKILNVTTKLHENLSFEAPAEQNHYSNTVTDLQACEVTITYTHPGYNDTVNTVVWLPSAENWTGRFLGAGGGGWSTGPETNTTLPWAASEGFASVATDGGHVGQDIEWSLVSPENVNWVLLQDFASIALDDAATLGKTVTEAYYGKAPSYSYWNGCSTGGRQGYMMAQRYPEQYNGILATAPAIYWNELMMQLFWPQVIMNENGMHLSPETKDCLLIHTRVPLSLRIRGAQCGHDGSL